MPDAAIAMLAYAQLAATSLQRGQLIGRDRFLLLAAVHACRAGYPAVASRAIEGVLANNPAHLIARYDSMADALRDEEFQPFIRQLERFCTYERAEHLLHEMGLTPESLSVDERTPGECALSLLEPAADETPSPDDQ